jgi:hypothetical protein
MEKALRWGGRDREEELLRMTGETIGRAEDEMGKLTNEI